MSGGLAIPENCPVKLESESSSSTVSAATAAVNLKLKLQFKDTYTVTCMHIVFTSIFAHKYAFHSLGGTTAVFCTK